MMRNEIIESTIDQILDKTKYTDEFKKVFKQFIKNKFDNNVSDGDLKRVWNYIEEVEEDNTDENVDC